MKDNASDRFIVSVKVGKKGQIIVPVEARTMFDIKAGDTLMFMGDKSRGIVLVKDTEFYKIMEGVDCGNNDK
jgi:AbrB family looped-hinge helix DNA binding protein